MGDVIALDAALGQRQSCYDCKYAYVGRSNIYCGFFREEMWSDSEAEECEAYEP